MAGANDAPISTKEAQTRVIVRDGGTTVIGGIYKVSTNTGEDRVPGLANMPIIGHLFKNRRREDCNERAPDLHHPAGHPDLAPARGAEVCARQRQS